MTGEQFSGWMRHMGLNTVQTSERLGIARNSVMRYQKEGAPLTVALACSALAMNLKPWPIA